MLETTHLRPHFDELSEKMWTLIPIGTADSLKLRQNALTRLQKEQFRPAALAAPQKVVSAIRNDRIFWLDSKSGEAAAVENEFMAFLQEIKNEIRNDLRVSLQEIECHYALYQKGHFYQRHRDTTSLENKRIFSFVLYLNENWKPEEGGQLVGYVGDQILFEVLPEIGHLILFRSDLEHEVKPTLRDRLSLTGWFRC